MHAMESFVGAADREEKERGGEQNDGRPRG